MRVVAGVGDGSIGEEAIVKKRTFEEEVDKGVEEVPDEESAKLGGRRGVKETCGGEVGGEEEGEGCKKTSDSAAIDHQCGIGGHFAYRYFLTPIC